MDKPRFFACESDKSGNKIIIKDEENIHLRSALRLQIGDEVEVFFGNGIIDECVIDSVGKKESVLRLVKEKVEPKDKLQVTLFMAITKSERMDWAVQKCTELGVSAIIPFESKFCTAKDNPNKVDRLNRIAISACKQSGRAYLPQIGKAITFNQLLSDVKQMKNVVVAYENDSTSAKDVLSKLSGDVAIIIGSEGGFSEDEINQLALNGAKVISLGKNILRAETAAVALSSVVLYQLNFWKREKNE